MSATSRLILFDCDGTLVDSQLMICAAMQQAFDDHGLVCPPRAEILSIVGLSLAPAVARLGQGRTGFPVESVVGGFDHGEAIEQSVMVEHGAHAALGFTRCNAEQHILTR